MNNKEVCKYCHGKGKFSVFRGGGEFGDSFDGRITIQPKIEEMPCLRCKKLENISPETVKEVESREEKPQNEVKENWEKLLCKEWCLWADNPKMHKNEHIDVDGYNIDHWFELVRDIIKSECQKAIEEERERCADILQDEATWNLEMSRSSLGNIYSLVANELFRMKEQILGPNK